MVKFGMCGCGGFIERAVLPMMRNVKNAQAVAAFDTNRERLEKICGEFKIKHACATFEELLEVDEADVIYVASPNVLHKEQTIRAAQAGKHVFCQKPMGINAVECREMIKVCRQNKVKLGVGFCYRFGGAQQKAKELVKKGAIGDVSLINISFNLGGYNPKTAGWRCDPKLSGGGPLMDVAPHLIDLASFLLDDRVESVMAYVRPEMTETEIEIDTLSLLEFSGGIRVSMDTSFLRGNTHNYTIIGTGGQIHAVQTMPWKEVAGRLTLQANRQEKEVSFSKAEHIEQEIRLYCRAIEKNEEPPVPGEAGLHVQAVIDAIYQSGRTGKRCKVKYERKISDKKEPVFSV